MKQIPNLFTLLNLVFGCMAIVCVLQPGLLLLPVDADGNNTAIPSQLMYVPEKWMLAPLFIGLAAVVDFLDGFVARLFNASSELGKQLDSLADVVSFGVAPGMILYHFLQLSYAQKSGALDVSVLALVPAFLVPAAAAYRLGKFNLNQSQSHTFKGVPTPAVGLLVASLPLVYWFTGSDAVVHLMQNAWFWYAFIIVVCFLMISSLPMLALKMKQLNGKTITPVAILVIVGIAGAFFLKWMAVPLVFLAYVVVSLLTQSKTSAS